MAVVLCFGDSNTWGTVPNEQRRYDENERWSGILNNSLADIEVIEEGQQGRTLIHNNPFHGEKSGQRYLKDCLEKYTPDLVLILLGTNDLKKRFSLTADDIAKSAAELVLQTQRFSLEMLDKKVEVLLIAPPPVLEVGFYAKMYQGAAAKSLQLGACYHHYSQQLGCEFFDAGSVIAPCPEEGVHWQVSQHTVLAQALDPIVRGILDKKTLIA